MFAARNTAGLDRARLAAAILLAALLGAGLAACRGFFGQAPIALLVADAGGDREVPVTITFDISDSSDPDGAITTYELDFGDGSAAVAGTDVSVPIEYEYAKEGTFTVLLTITDNDGRIAMANAVVTIGPVMITFASARGDTYDIYRMQSNGTNLVSVTATGAEELFPDVVPGRRDRIAYAAEDNTWWNIWTMTVTGGNRTQLTQTGSNQIQPDWSVSGSTIAYASNESGGWQIHTMTSLGTGNQQVTSQSPSWAIAPVFSPVNDDFLFVSNEAADGGSSIWLWDDSIGSASRLYDDEGRDGDASPGWDVEPTTVLDLPVGAGISRPTWSPDGTKIAFARERTAGGIIDIYVMDAADGGNAMSLEDYIGDLGVLNTNITTDEDEFAPFWLEDDSGIAFVKEDGSGGFQIHVVDFATAAVSVLTEAGSNVLPAAKR